MGEHIHFVTGRLAASALENVLGPLAKEAGFEYTVDILPITVAALMTPAWIAPRLAVPAAASRVVLPGYCGGDLTPIAGRLEQPVEVGPKDLRQLPEYFGQQPVKNYGDYSIEILAEINHAPRLPLPEVLALAKHYAQSGADVIDLGCDPGQDWPQVGEYVTALRSEGHRVSIDSFNTKEIAAAAQAGAELVLSVNAGNRHAAADWGIEVVAIPDEIATLGGLEETLEILHAANVPYRIDPILEPIGCGFAASLGRYLEVRRCRPAAPMMMGIGNLTELTDCDSAAVNVLLLGFCQELGIESVLTTEVINWARGSVRECDLARRLVHHAVVQGAPPKHVEPGLIMLRDEKLYEQGEEQLAALAEAIRDPNYRIFAERGKLHLISANLHLTETDPFLLFEALLATQPKNVDPAHAFYLGFELAKAGIALTLGKNYEQDESLNWGHLTVQEKSHRIGKGKKG